MAYPAYSEDAPQRPSSLGPVRRARAVAATLGTAALATGIFAVVLLTGTASATEPDVTPSTIAAPSPTLFDGQANATQCLGDPSGADKHDAPVAGTTIITTTGGNPSGTFTSAAGKIVISGTNVTVTIYSGFTANGIIVKGSDAYNLYQNPPTGFVGPVVVTGLTTPLTNGGQQAGVSHVFVCGVTSPVVSTSSSTVVATTPSDVETTPSDVETTPSDVETTPSDVETTPSDVETTPSVVETTPSDVETTPSDVETTPSDVETTPSDVTTTPSCDTVQAAVAAACTTDPGTPTPAPTTTQPTLPKTGSSLTGILVAGLALVLAGAAVLFLARSRTLQKSA